MTLINLINVVVVILGLFLATKIHFHIKRGKLIPETWPRLFGIGAGAVMFVQSMIGSILRVPLSEIVEYTVSNFIWSLAFGIVVYIGGRTLARRVRDKK
jgi:hypothetical protein